MASIKPASNYSKLPPISNYYPVAMATTR